MENWNHCLAMVLVQVAYGGSNVLVKLALAEGLNPVVFVVYRHVIALALLAPFAYVLERKQRPFSFSIAAKVFVLALFGTTIHLNVYYTGLAYISPTSACALINVIPSLTFLLAVLLRMEKLNVNSTPSQVKVVGTLLCIGGSLIFTVWKGGYMFKSFVDRPLITAFDTDLRHGTNQVKGSALIVISLIAWCSWIILQAVISKVYPAPLSLTTILCFFASLQSSFLTLFFARDPALWKLQWNLQLLAIVYCGVVLLALVYYLQAWCISYKGPVFAAMFSPLQVIIVAMFSAVAFAERLFIGSLIGTLLIAVGLYCVLWGKKQDGLAAEPAQYEKGELNNDEVLASSGIDIQVIDSISKESTCYKNNRHVPNKF